jgi:membrane protease subunit HflK
MRIGGYIIGILMLCYLASGIYIVSTDERGVVRRFGKVSASNVSPGLHYHWPYPISEVDKVKIRETKRISIGFEIADQVLGRTPAPLQTQFLTGDKNIINVQMMVQYRIEDPILFLFSVVDIRKIIGRCAEHSLTSVMSGTSVDSVLTVEKVLVQSKVMEEMQRELRKYRAGIQITSVNLKNVTPPAEVADAFNDVISAREDKNRFVHEAYGYKDEIVPKARGEAGKLVKQAQAYKHEIVNRARGRSDRFIEVVAEYKKAKDVTENRLYIDAMEEILPRLKKIVVDSDDDNAVDLSIIGAEK